MSEASAPKYAPDRVVDVRHLKIDVTPNFAAKTVHATTTITFTPISEPTRLVELNAVRLRIEEVASSRPLAEHSSTDEQLTLLFDEPIPVGEVVEVAITYTAEPKKGLYFRTADLGYPTGEDHIWTQGETHESPHWYPCFDYPNEKSTSEVTCRVPADMTVLSNGERIGSVVDPATGLKAVSWRQAKPHANYLVCLVAGYFHELRGESNGVPLGFYCQPEYAEHAPNAFQDTAAILAFFEQEIGVAYPWAKYDQVAIRDFNWGGMENTSLTTLTHETIYSNETENLKSSRNLDAHELAHQWFGDYVTCRDWSHLWLNEGFATYYTHLYAGHKLGRDELLYGLYRDATAKVLPSSKKDARPIVHRKYADPWEQFDFRAYPKGSWVLHMLRSRMGEERFRSAVKLYLERHALASVDTDDLRRAFEDVSGQPLDAFFDQWLYNGGAPKIEVTHKWLAEDRLLRVTVEQAKPAEGTQPFTFPVTLRAHAAGQVVDRRVEIDEAKQDFYLPLSAKPDVVRFDPEYTVLAEVDHKKSEAMLEKQLKLSDDVIGRLLAATALGKKETAAATKALAEALASDAFYGVRIAAAKGLAKQGTPAALEALLTNIDQDDARVRQQVVGGIDDYAETGPGEERAVEALRRVFAEDRNPAIRDSALIGLAKHPVAPIADEVRAALTSDSFQSHRLLAAANAIGKRREPTLVEPLVEALSTRRGEVPGRRYGGALASLARAAKESEDTASTLRLLRSALRDHTISVRLGAINAMGLLGDEEAIPTLQALSSPTGKIGPAARKAIEQIESEASRPAAAVERLRSQLRELRDEQTKLRETVERLDAAVEGESEE